MSRFQDRPVVTCARCGRERQHLGRGLCWGCATKCTRDGTLEDYPLKVVPMRWILEEMDSPAFQGRPFIEVAQAMGLKPKSAERQYYRARQKGLVA